MNTRVISIIKLGICVAFLLQFMPGNPSTSVAKEPNPPIPTKSAPEFPDRPSHGQLRQSHNGKRYMPSEASPILGLSSESPQATGGPDDFGYTWNDSVAYSWETTSTNSGITGDDMYGLVSIGFPFKYYEQIWHDVYVTTNGILVFGAAEDGCCGGFGFPSPASPNNVIAPFSEDLAVGGGQNAGGIFIKNGGTSPNRFFVVEWHDITVFGDDWGDTYTFQVILHEKGDIVFQYQTVSDTWWWYTIGIEDSYGLDGLAYPYDVGNGDAIRFYRPSPSARVNFYPRFQGHLTHAGKSVDYQVDIRNTGELGSDTYDLFLSSSWTAGLYAEDGLTPLTDTDSDGIVDTGPVGESSTTTITVRVTTPGGASLGDDNSAEVTARSSINTSKNSTTILRTAIPAPFAQVFSDDANGAMSLYLAQPGGQVTKPATQDWHYGDNPAIAEMPESFAYFWSSYRWLDPVNISEIEYTLLDCYGEVQRSSSKLTNHSGASLNTYDYDPTVTVAPNGNIGVIWRRWLYNSDYSQFNTNIYFAILDKLGNLIYGPTNLTQNEIWGDWDSYNVPSFYSPRIAATSDNRFILAWDRDHEEKAGWVEDIYYAVRNNNGDQILPVSKLTNDSPGGDFWNYYPTLAQLTNNRVLIAWSQKNSIAFKVLDSSGNIIHPLTTVSMDGWFPDAVQLSSGQIVVAWTHWDEIYQIAYAVFDGGNYNNIAGPFVLSNPAAPAGDGYVSVTADNSGHAILTWLDGDYNLRRNMYYALVDNNGDVLTDATIFYSSQTGESDISSSYEGYGNTSYSWIPPAEVDGTAAFKAPVFPGSPGGNARVRVHLANNGATTATNVVLTDTLDNDLTYAGDSSGITPTEIGNQVIWNLPDMNLLESLDFDIYVQVPLSAAYGTQYPVSMEIATDGPEATPENNTDNAEILAARQSFLPVIANFY